MRLDKKFIMIVFVLVGLLLNPVQAHAVPYFKSDLPDFYQHQKSFQGQWPTTPPTPYPGAPDPPPSPLKPAYDNKNWWEPDGGWCCIAAFANSFYYWEKNGYPGLFFHDAGKKWQDYMVYGIEDLAIDVFYNDRSIPDYIAKYGYGSSLVYQEYFWDDTKGQVMRSTKPGGCGPVGATTCDPTSAVPSGYTSMFDLYYDELKRSEDVEITIEGATGVWWDYHVITGAGVELDKSTPKLWFADPDNTIHGSGWGHPYTGADTLPVPTPEDAATSPYYSMVTLKGDGRTLDTGPYAGAVITRIFTISPVPEPSALFLLGSGLVGLVGLRIRRRFRS